MHIKDYIKQYIIDEVGECLKLKEAEYKLQQAIESIVPNQCWWKTTKIKIFEELLSGKRVDVVAEDLAIDLLLTLKKGASL